MSNQDQPADAQPQNQTTEETPGKFSLLGLKINLEALLTGRDDPTVGKVSVLSNPAEKHAILAGFAGGMVDGANGRPIQEGAAGSGLYATGRVTSLFGVGEHTKDAKDQVAYTGFGYLVGFGVGSVLGVQGVRGLMTALGV